MFPNLSGPRSTPAAGLAVLSVVGARLRAQPGRSALVVAGVALAFVMLAGVLGASLVARQQALGRALADVPDSARRFRIDRFGLPLDDRAYRRADAEARRAFAAMSGSRPDRVVFFRELRVEGELVEIAAVDDLAGAVHLISGRLPGRCTSARCDLVQIGARGKPSLDEGDVHLRRVGVATLRDPDLFSAVSASAAGGAAAPVLFLAPSIAALQHYEPFSTFYRIYSWLSPLPAGGAHTWDVSRILAAESRAQSVLYDQDPGFRLSGPDDLLTDAMSRGDVTAHRLVLVGGETSALLLGFAVIAAVGLRRGLAAEQRRLLARGARRWQVALARTVEIGAMTLTGALAGLACALAVVAAVASAAGQPVGAILTHALLDSTAVGVLLAAFGVTTLVLVGVTLARDDEAPRRRVGTVDVAAVGAVVTVAVSLSRGALDPETVSSSSTVMLLLLPALVCFVAAVVLARALGPAMRAAERLTRERSLTLRLAVLALARAPSRTVVSCAFVAVALGLALFAASYRGTLDRGATDQAAFAVPLDFVVGEGDRLVQPLDAAPLSAYRAVPGVTHAYAVLRTSATTPGVGSAVLSPTVLGLPAGAVARLRWRSDLRSHPPSWIAARLAPSGEPRLSGTPLPTGAQRVSVPARLEGAGIVVDLVLQDARGRTRFVRLGRIERGGTTLLEAALPRLNHATIVGLRVALPVSQQFFLAHRETDSHVVVAPSGVLRLGPLRIATRSGRWRVVTAWRGWVFPSGSLRRRQGDTDVSFAFADTGAELSFRPREATDGRHMPVVVSLDVAHAAGGVGQTLPLSFGDVSIQGLIVDVAKALPGVPASAGPFVLADAGWLSTAVNADAPGEGTPAEIWMSSAEPGRSLRALGRPPFSSLDVSSRRAIETELASDPLARATARVLVAAGVVALALAVLGFWVGVVSELRDERSDFFDLEARGVPPESLRAQLRTRGLILVVLGVAGGIALAAALSRLVVSLVQVSATSGVPEPALALDPALAVCGLALVAVTAAALLVAELTARAAFRGDRPERVSWSLE